MRATVFLAVWLGELKPHLGDLVQVDGVLGVGRRIGYLPDRVPSSGVVVVASAPFAVGPVLAHGAHLREGALVSTWQELDLGSGGAVQEACQPRLTLLVEVAGGRVACEEVAQAAGHPVETCGDLRCACFDEEPAWRAVPGAGDGQKCPGGARSDRADACQHPVP